MEEEWGMSIFGGLFWGILLLAAGLIILLKLVFNLQVSAGKLIFGLFILMIGVSMLVSGPGWGIWDNRMDNANLFSGGRDVTVAGENTEYSTVFGSGTYDATDMKPGDRVKINCAFGSCKVLLPDKDVYVTASCAFGTVHMPDDRTISFNSGFYGQDSANTVRIEISCAFGSVNVSQDK
jgi:hypothetical protein